MDWAKTTARRDKKHLSLGNWCAYFLEYTVSGEIDIIYPSYHLVLEVAKCMQDGTIWSFISADNVRKWEKTLSDDERDLEKLKKEESKHMKVGVCLAIILLTILKS